MARITFSRVGVERCLRHTQAAVKHIPLSGQKAPVPACLWLVGDEGIYLMSNGEPYDPRRVGHRAQHVVYANECSPRTLSPSKLDAAKRAILGGDDGVDWLLASDVAEALATYEPGGPLILDITANKISLVAYQDEPETTISKGDPT
jgi:hypothetical protein